MMLASHVTSSIRAHEFYCALFRLEELLEEKEEAEAPRRRSNSLPVPKIHISLHTDSPQDFSGGDGASHPHPHSSDQSSSDNYNASDKGKLICIFPKFIYFSYEMCPQFILMDMPLQFHQLYRVSGQSITKFNLHLDCNIDCGHILLVK